MQILLSDIVDILLYDTVMVVFEQFPIHLQDATGCIKVINNVVYLDFNDFMFLIFDQTVDIFSKHGSSTFSVGTIDISEFTRFIHHGGNHNE